jgi:hypothetical protein
MLTHNGKTQTVFQWASELKISPKTLLSRLRIGWTVERTLSTPQGPRFGGRNGAS